MNEFAKVIDPVDPELIRCELTEQVFLRTTRKAGNSLFLFTGAQCPHTLREIGRLREETFRAAGGGTGKELDIDAYDTSDHPFMQLVVWDPDAQEIMAGYRVIICRDGARDEQGNLISPTSRLFQLSSSFVTDYMPFTIELGRSFVHPNYQQRNRARKGLFALDNLWDGLGALIALYPDMRYFFGKVTMYPQYDRSSRNILMSFMHHFFPDPDHLVTPHIPLIAMDEIQQYMHHWDGLDYKAAFAVLNKFIRERGENVPPLINTYMGISETMRVFGTAKNEAFGNVEETGILVTIPDIFDSVKSRHVEKFNEYRTYQGLDPA